jgi:hypothetical protein
MNNEQPSSFVRGVRYALPGSLLAWLLIALVIFSAARACGQESPHYWTKKQIALQAANAVLSFANAAYSEHAIHKLNAHEDNALMAPLINRGWPGAMAAVGINVSAETALSYVFYRTHHPKLTVATPLATMGESGAAIVHDLVVMKGQ